MGVLNIIIQPGIFRKWSLTKGFTVLGGEDHNVLLLQKVQNMNRNLIPTAPVCKEAIFNGGRGGGELLFSEQVGKHDRSTFLLFCVAVPNVCQHFHLLCFMAI